MIKISDYIDKDIVSLKTAHVVCACTTALTDLSLKRVTQLGDGKQFVPFSKIFKTAEKTTADFETAVESLDFCPLQKTVLDTFGRTVGVVRDLEIKADGEIKALLTDDKRISPRSVLRVGDVILLRGRLPKQKETKLPQARFSADFTFLLGRTCDKNISDFFGETIIKKGTVVTRETLRLAHSKGKTVELSLHAK